ncbi:MAG: Hsp70 family protein [Treponema sp.]|jgi:hypothetical protein|nr:Hsp70 family protein [Treponema sp.]
MAGTIGIKIANGDFYPIMAGNTTVKKRLVLTTVHDGQESVQIDLFRSVLKSMDDAQYIGSLMVENIKPRPRGEPSIEMIISSDADGHITADACDLEAGGKHQILNVLHKEESSFAEFDLGSKPQTPAGLYGKAETFEEEKRRYPWLIMIFALIFVIIAIGLLWFFFYGDKNSNPFKDTVPFFKDKPGYGNTAPETPPPPVEKIQPVEPPREPPAPPPAVTPPPEEAPIIQAPVAPPPARPQAAERKRPPAPVSSYKVPAVIPKDGVAYRIRWGDTLWDISEAFYRNPWLYPRIARHNNIRNPDVIISGRTIRIPPKN